MKTRSKVPAYGQMNALIAIAYSLRVRGQSPTIREIREEIRVSSTNIVAEHVDRLEAKGWISREPGQHRGIQLTDKALWFFGMEARAPGRWIKSRPTMGDGRWYKVLYLEPDGTRTPGFFLNVAGTEPEDWDEVDLRWSSAELMPPMPKGTK